jgi:V8-like Glu-specific endopeptidase
MLPLVATAQSPEPPPSIFASTTFESGYLSNAASKEAVVWSHRFQYAATDWFQLEFGKVTNLPDGSYLRMTSARDGGMQRHTGRTLNEWSFVSAMFNGGDVLLELVAAPGSSANRVNVTGYWRGISMPVSPNSICGPTDNRAQSTDPRQGRLWVGCTGWMISGDIMLTAGHCTTSGTRILEMNVPNSTAGGSLVRSNPNDQYPYTELSGLNGGVGADWGVCRVGVNSNHGQLPTQRNGGQWYTLGAVPGSTAGQNIRITGYGTSSIPTLTQVQKTHVGPLSSIGGTSLCYSTDTTGGNSGSPVLHENTGLAIGIHTHGGCSSGGGCNSGTRIDRSDLRSAIQAVMGTARFNIYGQGCPAPAVFYETFSGGNDLSNRSFLLTRNGSGWVVTNCASNCFETNFSGALNSGDDQLFSNVALGFNFPLPGGGNATSVAFDSNGWVGLVPGQFTGSDFSESVTEFLSEGMRVAAFWDDLNPASAGDVYFDTFPGRAVITWAGIPEFGTTNSNTFQVQIFSNGNVRLSYQSMAAGDGLVGYSPGGGVSDPGAIDITSAVPFSTGSGGSPLQFNASDAPRLGSTINLGLSSVPGGVIANAINLGFASQNLDLTLIGMPGCRLLTTLDVILPVAASSPNAATSFAIPNIPSLNGAHVFAQGVSLVPGINAIGAITSNGGDLTIGT